MNWSCNHFICQLADIRQATTQDSCLKEKTENHPGKLVDWRNHDSKGGAELSHELIPAMADKDDHTVTYCMHHKG